MVICALFFYDYSFLIDFPEKVESSESSESGPDIDPEDPMRDYLYQEVEKRARQIQKEIQKRTSQRRNS